MLVDFTDDIDGKVFLKIAKGGTLPEFIRDFRLKDPKDLNDDCFGLIVIASDGSVHKKFPVYDKASTWLSANYFLETFRNLPEGAQKVASVNLKNSLKKYSLEVPDLILKIAETVSDENISNVFDELSSPTSPTSEISQYVLEDEKRFPITGQDDVKRYATNFQNIIAGMTEEEKGRFAFNLARVAKQYEVYLKPYILDQAKSYALKKVRDTTSPESVNVEEGLNQIKEACDKFVRTYKNLFPYERMRISSILYKKASKFKDKFIVPDIIRFYAERRFNAFTKTAFDARYLELDNAGRYNDITLLKYIYKKASEGYDLNKLASALEEFDRKSGLYLSWDRGIPDPYLTFGAYYKQAEPEYRNNLKVSYRKLASNPIARRIFPEDVLNAIMIDPGIVENMSPYDRKILDKLASIYK